MAVAGGGIRWIRAHPFAALATIAFAGAASFAAALFLLRDPEQRVLADNLVQLFAYLLAANTCYLTSQRVEGPARRAWAFFAVAAAAQSFSQLLVTAQVLRTGAEPATFTTGQLGFVLFFVFAVAGLIVVSAGPLRASALARRVADGIIIAGSLIVTTWQATVGGGSSDALGPHAVAVALSLGDVVMATLVLLILARYRMGRGPLLLLLTGLVTLLAADTVAAYLRAEQLNAPKEIFSVAWVLAFLLLAAAALMADGEEILSEETRPSLPLLLLPYVSLLFAMSLLVARRASGEPPRFAEAVVTLLLVMVVLIRQLLTLTETHRLLTALADREQQMRHQALHDPLTGLANRALFTDRVEHALTMHGRTGEGLVVMFCDLDDFKHVNDSLGHPAGDALLVALARRMREVVRAGDTVARLGGDEFALLIEQPEDDTGDIAQRLLTAICAPLNVDGSWLFPSVSIGSAVLAPLHGPSRTSPTVSRLLADADAAMYVAKAAGKGRHASALQGEIDLAPYRRPDFDPLDVSLPLDSVVTAGAMPAAERPATVRAAG